MSPHCTHGTLCFLSQANRSREVFTKYVESVLQKSAKIRSLVGELQRVYPSDPTAQKFLGQVNQNIFNHQIHKFDELSFHVTEIIWFGTVNDSGKISH